MLSEIPLWLILAVVTAAISLAVAQAESRLRESEQKYRVLFESNPNPMWVFDEETMRFLAVNEAAIQHYGYSREEFLSMSIFAIRPPEDVEELRTVLADRLKGIQPARRTWRHRKRSGEFIQVEVVHKSIVFGRRKAALISIKDVTGILQAEAERSRAHETLSAILEASPLVICAHDLNGVVQFCNPATTSQLGWTPEDLIGNPPRFIREKDAVRFGATFSLHLHGEGLKGIEWLAQCKDGSEVPYSIWTAPLRDSEGGITGVISAAADLTERKKAEALEQDRNRVLELVATNRPSQEVLRSVEEMVERQFPGRRCSVAVDSDVREAAACGDVSAPIFSFAGGKIGAVELSAPDSTEMEVSTKSLLNLASHLSSIAIEHERIYAKLEFDARHDSLTGLPNRMAFEEALVERMSSASARNQRLAVLYLDLDRFKQINDTLGHRVGDQYLQEVARRLWRQLWSPDLLFRLGGDEFVVVLPGVESSMTAETVADRMLQVFGQPVQLGSLELFGKASIGISIYPDDGRDAEALKQHADSAMYRAKRLGGNCWHVFKPEMGRNAREELDLERGLHRALEENRLVIHYQPKYRRNGQLAGAEALLRYRHPEKGLILPERFIAMAEETGLIVPIGGSVLQEACRQTVAWQRAGFGPLRVAVNVSAVQIGRPDFADSVARIIECTQIRPDLLELELTESALMDSVEHSLRQMLRLRALGVRFSIDDFGTGFSSLSYLHRLPIDELKIDRSFVQGLGHPTSTLPLVEAILAVGRSMGLDVVAEGVENVTQLETLRELGCPTMQGFYLGRPVPADEFALLLEAGVGALQVVENA